MRAWAALFCWLLWLAPDQAFEMRDGFLALCDGDRSGGVDKVELAKCFSKAGDGGAPSAESVLRIADTDGDGEITGEEYVKLLGELEKSTTASAQTEFATFKSRDGKVHSLNRREFEDLVRQSEQLQARIRGGADAEAAAGGGGGGGKEKRRSLEAIAKEDPEMAKFLAIVQWAVDGLKSRGNHFGRVLQMASLPPGGSNFRDKGGANVAVDWGGVDHADIWFEFSADKGSGSAEEFYEVYVERNAAIYRRPYLAIKGAWSLDASGRRKSELPLPKPRMSRHPVAPGQVTEDEGELKLLALLPVLALGLLCLWSVRGFLRDWAATREARKRQALLKKSE